MYWLLTDSAQMLHAWGVKVIEYPHKLHSHFIISNSQAEFTYGTKVVQGAHTSRLTSTNSVSVQFYRVKDILKIHKITYFTLFYSYELFKRMQQPAYQ